MPTLKYFSPIAVLLLFLGAAPSAAEEPQAYREQIKQLISWLPKDTESLVVGKASEEGDVEAGTFEPRMFSGSQGALHVLREGKFRKGLADHPTIAALQASCRFRNPGVDRSAVQYDGCQLVLFEKNIQPAADKLLETMAADADGEREISGRRVLHFKEEWHRQKWEFFVAFPTPRVLVVATEEKYLRDLIERIDRKENDAGLFVDEPLASALPLDAIYWGARQYKRPVYDIPQDALGFVFQVNLADDDGDARVTYFSAKNIPEKTIRRLWSLFPPDVIAPEVKQLNENVYEIRHSLNDNEKISGVLLVIYWRLGHVFG